MYQLIEGTRINKINNIVTNKQTVTRGIHYAFLNNIQITFNKITSTLITEYRFPIIEGTQWQGELNINEQRHMLLQIDDSPPVELTVINGIAQQELVFEQSGTYLFKVYADFGCEPAELEVTI